MDFGVGFVAVDNPTELPRRRRWNPELRPYMCVPVTEQRVRTLSDQIRVLNDQHTRQINANARELQALGIQIQTLESRLNELEDHLRVRRESVVAGTSSPSAFAVFRFIGCRRDRPLAHPGGAGLLWAIQGGRLVELHRDWAVIELAANGSRRVFERRRVDAGNVTLPWIE
jgi:hypothetical protein